MSELDQRPVAPPPAPPPAGRRRRPRRGVVLLSAVLLVVVGVGVFWWLATRPPAPVSVPDVVNRFRTAQPTTHPGTHPAGPAAGVYVYATAGWEKISSGNVTHRYPARTTLSVTDIGCGLRLRWDALSDRWWQADLCATGSGWQLTRYTDVHKFLYVRDVHAYTCEPPTPTADGFTVRCRYSGGELTSTVHRLGTGRRTLAGKPVTTEHLRIDQRGTGTSTTEGTTHAWVLPNGLPVHVDVVNHGSQVVLGSRVSYDENASFDLTSATPRR